MNALPASLVTAISAVGQSEVLRFYDALDAAGRGRLRAQLESIDWDQIPRLCHLAASAGSPAEAAGADFTSRLANAVTPPCLTLGGPTAETTAAIGRRALALGHIGAVLVAGGQGSRLGCQGPKGVVPVGPVSGASLFDILLGKLRAVRRRHGAHVPLAIMTSSATDADTKTWLREHDHGGLDPEQVLVFRQSDLPALDATSGKILLDAPDRIAMAPDGHGGMLPALVAAGGLEWFAARGCRDVVTFQVDNPLTMPLHPEFLGHHIGQAADFSTQVVRKHQPGERVGIVATSAGRTFVVEYSDLPANLAAERRPDGLLRFHAGSIAVHAFALDFLNRAAAAADPLPLHLARKSVPHLTPDGQRVVPAQPNAIKFERFIFDLMPLAERVCLVEIDPAEGFAPLKNPPGAAADAIEHVQAALVAHARGLLAKGGICVADAVVVELDSASILDEDDIRAAVPPGSRIDSPRLIGG